MNHISIIGDLIRSGKAGIEFLRDGEKKELMSSYIRSLGLSAKWELICDADLNNVIPDLLADVLDGKVSSSYLVDKLLENAYGSCEEELDDLFQEQIGYISKSDSDIDSWSSKSSSHYI